MGLLSRVRVCALVCSYLFAVFGNNIATKEDKLNYGEHCVVKKFKGRSIGDGIALIKEVFHVKDLKSCKSFIFKVAEPGNYYITVFLRGIKNNNYNVYIDNQAFAKKIVSPQKDGWQYSFVIEKSDQDVKNDIFFSGTHTITFTSKNNITPAIDDIKLDKSLAKCKMDKNKFLKWYQNVKKTPYTKRPPKNNFSLKEGSNLNSSLDNPLNEFTGWANQSFNYTYREWIHLNEGDVATFEATDPIPSSTDPVLYLFHESLTEYYSYSNDDGGSGALSKLTVTIPATGMYQLMVREYWSGTGTVDIYKNGTKIEDNVVVAGKCFNSNLNNTNWDSPNFFSCKPGYSSYDVDPYLYIAGLSPVSPIEAYNDDYYTDEPHDFNWGYLPRIQGQFGSGVRYVILSAYWTGGTCDFYMHPIKGNSTVLSVFENLENNDAMTSSSLNLFDYNCISWSGGVTSTWHWPPDPGSPYYSQGNDLKSFDNYYGNKKDDGSSFPRYANAWNYTRTGATYNNAVVDLWAHVDPLDYTHGSVRSPGNDLLHGYDWESKPGSLARTFHPRNSLEGNAYGQIVDHYVQAGFAMTPKGTQLNIAKNLSFDESVQLRLTVIPKPEVYSSMEITKLEKLNRKVSLTKQKIFNRLLYTLDNVVKSNAKIASSSNPKFYMETLEYTKILNFCRDEGKQILPLLFKKMAGSDNYIFRYLISDLTYEKYGDYLDEIVDNLDCFTPDGSVIAYSHKNTYMKYVKMLLKNEF